ncbi:MAG: hypothetical protein QNJ63_09760 [Calothrix sp. MO_192.B10]|nr:hypothetical protein [Calothrix sp. MO_192.B10]
MKAVTRAMDEFVGELERGGHRNFSLAFPSALEKVSTVMSEVEGKRKHFLAGVLKSEKQYLKN